MKKEIKWYSCDSDETLSLLESNLERGLSVTAIQERLDRYGPNELVSIAKMPWYKVFMRQFTNVLILILFVAAMISLAIGAVKDAITILVIIVLNGVLGFIQESKSENAIEALKKMLLPTCTVLRDGKEQLIDTKLLVPGDIVLLENGDEVPADLRLLESFNLKIDESALTGESVSVSKQETPLSADTVPLEQKNMIWMGTAVVNGSGRGIVVETGMSTEFGKIAQMTQSVQDAPTPLQKKLSILGKKLGIYALSISALVAIIGWLTGRNLLEMFLTGVALAVAAVPEGLPAVVTITLALGVKAMSKQKALIRNLQSAETLGAATTICTDKTGTLTQNKMTVTKIWLASQEIDVTGVGYDPTGHFELKGHNHDYKNNNELLKLLQSAMICNRATLHQNKEDWQAIGEPTEIALIVAAYKAWLVDDESEVTVTEFSFNSMRKRMTVIVEGKEGRMAYVKGAPEVILERCSHILKDTMEVPLDEKYRQEIEAAYITMAKSGLRTLAIASRKLPKELPLEEESVEESLVLLGLVGIIDAPHDEVPNAIKMAQTAGIDLIMITGDNADTATAIGKSIGLNVKRMITSQELSKMDDESLDKALDGSAHFARARPEDKFRIVQILKKRDEIVAMTGDGVNDAPALKEADIGIAMGKEGTAVAKSAADMVLTDDNFASIINAVREGRREYDNIQKFVLYLLSSNSGEVIAIFANILLGGPLILIPVQILWMNLVTDGMTAIALGVEPADKGIMKRPPREVHAPILDRYGIVMIIVLGGYIGLATLGLFHYYSQHDAANDMVLAQTVAFTAIIIFQKVNVLNFRSLYEPITSVGFFTNKWLLVAIGSTILLQVGAVYLPFLQNALHTTALGWKEWGIITAAALPIFIITELFKRIRARYA